MRDHRIECNIIDWRITARCNSGCDYCYASAVLPELPERDIDRIITAIVESGAKTVCITGGEPLLSDNALTIIKKLHNAGISIYLSTNGTKYMEHRDELEKYISKLSLPLDGYDEESNQINGRKINPNESDSMGFETVKEILDYYEVHTHNFAIKVGSVLTSRNNNIEHFRKIYNFLEKYTIDLWKIYEFLPEGRGKDNINVLSLSQDEITSFSEEFTEFQKEVSNSGEFEILLSTRNMRDAAYFIIQPNGTVIVPIDKGLEEGVDEVLVGDLLSQNVSTILQEWYNKVNSIKHIANYETRRITRPFAEIHIDKVDKEIIYLLDRDPLQNYNDLAKKVTLGSINAKEVARRIDKLYSIRAIRHIMPIINVSQFGLEVYLLNLYFKENSSLDAAQIAEILCHDPYIAWVSECYEYNSDEQYVIFRISILIENNKKLYERVKYLRSIFGEMLYRYEMDVVPDKYVCGQSFLMEKIDESCLSHDHITLDSNRTRITKQEYSVIATMAVSERLSIESIAKATSMTEKKVNQIIDGLLAKVVINKFQVVLDTNVLGYQCYMFFVKFDFCENKDRFEDYVKKLPNVTHINTLNAGMWDIDVEIHVEKPSVCAAIWADIESKFSDTILDKKLIRIKKDHKFKFLIDSTLKAIEDSIDKRWWSLG